MVSLDFMEMNPKHYLVEKNIVDAFDAISDLECDAYFINCCGANMVTEAIGKLRKLTKKPIGAYANSDLINTTSRILQLMLKDHWSSATTARRSRVL